MKITKIKIRDYRGIHALEAEISPAGAIIVGDNEKGKTTVLNAIRAALAANGVTADDIRNGAETAEIVVDMDAVRARRRITRKSTAVVVSDSDGREWPKPQTRLNELLGTSAIDPLDFFLADAKGRRAQILAAMPVRVTAEDVAAWTGENPPDLAVPGTPDLTNLHGFEALGLLRQRYYDARTHANAETDKATNVLALASEEATPLRERAKFTQPTAAALEAAREASTALSALEGRAASAAAAAAAVSGVREKIAVLRRVPGEGATEEAIRLAIGLVDEKIERLKAERVTMDRQLAALEQASALEASITTADPGPTPEDLANARQLSQRRQSILKTAEERDQAVKLIEAENAAAEAAAAAGAKARALDTIVKRLTNEAPRELGERGTTIKGLEFDGDRIRLDGVDLDSLSGARQMELAVEIARRANATAKAKILIVDEMERLSPKRFQEFVKHATSDGWQLLGTKVTDGELTIEAIQP